MLIFLDSDQVPVITGFSGKFNKRPEKFNDFTERDRSGRLKRHSANAFVTSLIILSSALSVRFRGVTIHRLRITPRLYARNRARVQSFGPALSWILKDITVFP